MKKIILSTVLKIVNSSLGEGLRVRRIRENRFLGLYLSVLLFTVQVTAFAQTDSLTMRDDLKFKYYIRKNLIPDYAKLLIFIADNTNSSNEIESAIDMKVNGGKEMKIFTDSKVIIENDLKPGADTNKILRADKEVNQYLSNFNTSYAKSEDKSVYLTFLDVSPIKFTSYYYYNVLFECNYTSTNSNGERFKPFNRVAEVKLVNDSGWHLYINAIRFPNGNEMDTINAFTNLIVTDTSMVNILAAYDIEERQKLKEQRIRIQSAIDEGDDKMLSGDFDAALKKYREARLLNTDLKEVKDKIDEARKALTQKKLEEQRKAEREKHIAEMKKQARELNDDFKFKAAKVLCDSLTKDFGVADADILQMSNNLSIATAAMEGIINLSEKGSTAEAIKLCREKINEVKELFYRSHFYYLQAVNYTKLPKQDVPIITDNLDKAIGLSEKKHQEALKMRAQLRLDKGNIIGAIEDANMIINNDSRNPANYNFLGMIHEEDKNIAKAIEDYGNAIINKSTDPIVFLKKARLEYQTQKYNEVKKTTTAGLEVSKCRGILHFYRGLAEEKTGEFMEAGKDFRNAVSCGVIDSTRKAIKTISEFYLVAGDTALAQKQTNRAIKEYSKSILIDSSDNALYKRAKSFLMLSMSDSALVDLNALIQRNPNYTDAYSQRGTTLTNLDRFADANKDFEMEIKKSPTNTDAYYAKGKSELTQKKYKAATASFEKSALLVPSDSVHYMISFAAYYDKDYTKAIAFSKKARNKRTTDYQLFYICGRAYYDSGNYDDAIKEFNEAKQLVKNNEEVLFRSGAALQANKEYVLAAADYDKLTASTKYKDAALFLSAKCLIKTYKDENILKAIWSLEQYSASKDTTLDQCSALAYKAYAYLFIDSLPQAEQAIEAAKKLNTESPMLQLVQACKYVKTKENEKAFPFLDNAMASKSFSKSEIAEEKMLKPIARNERFKILIGKYYPEN